MFSAARNFCPKFFRNVIMGVRYFLQVMYVISYLVYILNFHSIHFRSLLETVILKPWWNILWIHQSKHDMWGWYPQGGKITFLWGWNSTAVLLIFNPLRWQTQTDDWTNHATNGFIMVYYCKISRPRKKEERFCTNNFKPRYLIFIFRLVSTQNPLTVQSTWSNCMLAKIYAHKTAMCLSEQTCSFGISPVRN